MTAIIIPVSSPPLHLHLITFLLLIAQHTSHSSIHTVTNPHLCRSIAQSFFLGGPIFCPFFWALCFSLLIDNNIVCFAGASLKAAAGGRADPLPLLPLPPRGRAGQALPLLPAVVQPPAHHPPLPQQHGGQGHPLQQGQRQSTRVPAT